MFSPDAYVPLEYNAIPDTLIFDPANWVNGDGMAVNVRFNGRIVKV